MKATQITKLIYQMFPKKLAHKQDYIGYAFSTGNKKVSKILTTLDVTSKVVDYAIKNNFDMIISHHPFFFGKRKEILKCQVKQKNAHKIKQHKLVVFSAHTCLDGAKKGTNNWFLKAFQVDKITYIKNAYAQIGSFKQKKPVSQLIALAKKYFDVSQVIVNYDIKKVKKIMVAGGSHDKITIDLAKSKKVDLLITGELKFHDWIYANEIEQPVMVVGHFMEIIFNQNLANLLKNKISIEIKPYQEKNFLIYK